MLSERLSEAFCERENQRESKGMNQRESWEKFESRRRENKREGGREGGRKKKGGKRRKRAGVELESGGRLPLWPDVNLSKQPQLGSRASAPVGLRPSAR